MNSKPTQIRAAIVDDEPLAREGVKLLLESDPDVEIIGEAGSGTAALELLRKEEPDLLFLDVEMPEMNGFELLGALDRDKLPVVVFVSAYDAYAIRAFEVHALDYLQKPFEDERFYEALKRAKDYVRLSQLSDLSSRLIDLLESYGDDRERGDDAGGAATALKRIAIKSAGRVVYVDVDDIDWIEAADYYVQLHVGDQSHLHRQTMSSLAQQLDGRIFCRIHRSAIVNLSRVREVCHSGRRDVYVVLDNGVELRVARRHRDKLQRMLEARTRA
jgi:two-component system LytT family response regulator